MDYIHMSAKQRLYTLATTALQQSERRGGFPLQVQDVSEKLFQLMLAHDSDNIWLECAGGRAIDIVQQYVAEFLERDVYGGGIGLRLDDKTGENAAADETSQSTRDTHVAVAHSSAPQSQTPAEKLVGGGQLRHGPHEGIASPTSTPDNADYTTVKQHPRLLPGRKKVPELEAWSSTDIKRPQPPYNPPAVSKRILAKVAKDSALAILQNIQCNGRPVLQAPGDEALKWAESILLSEDEKIRHSAKRMNEAFIVQHFAQGVPPTMTLEEFYGQYPDEYARRKQTVGGTKAAVTTRIEALAHAG